MSSKRTFEWWIAVVRLGTVALAVLEVAGTPRYPGHYQEAAWILTAILGAGAVALFAAVRRGVSPALKIAAMTFDFGIISAFVVLFAFQAGTPVRSLLFVAIVLGASRFGLFGGIGVAVAAVPVAAWFEARRSHIFHDGYRWDFVTFQAGAGLLMALLAGWLVARLEEERATERQRAQEAVSLRDELGRRADLLEAAARCARALSSSLDMDEAFGAFIRELRGVIPFERMAIVLAEEGHAQVMAVAGARAEEVMPPGTRLGLERNLLTEVVESGQTVYRPDLTTLEYAEEPALLGVGVRSRVLAPLLAGPRGIGVLSVGRGQPDAFSRQEIELVGLLGRLVASAVQNIRAYAGERRTVEELRRLTELRADFVSLVSHELRSPMAAVIGAARTLQQRWQDLDAAQRESFLALIGDETTRLAALVGDVLDTSRIDAGTFSYRFADVDLAALVHEAVRTAGVGQEEVPVVADVRAATPTIRADRERLRQVLVNLIDNAVKYSPPGAPVEVRLAPVDGSVQISVSDRGPGIHRDDQRLVFEKFGRVSHGVSKPGTGLGLFIARSIVEAHGGTLSVSSAPGRGATFTLLLPAS